MAPGGARFLLVLDEAIAITITVDLHPVPCALYMRPQPLEDGAVGGMLVVKRRHVPAAGRVQNLAWLGFTVTIDMIRLRRRQRRGDAAGAMEGSNQTV